MSDGRYLGGFAFDEAEASSSCSRRRRGGSALSTGGIMMTLAIVTSLGALVWLIAALLSSTRKERSRHRSVWRELGLGPALMTLFTVGLT